MGWLYSNKMMCWDAFSDAFVCFVTVYFVFTPNNFFLISNIIF